MKKQATRRDVFKNIMLGSAAIIASPGLSIAERKENENKTM